MNQPGRFIRGEPPAPRAKWWGSYVVDGDPPRLRHAPAWRRILAAAGVVCLAAYLALATLLWGYYTFARDIPGVHWIDVAVLPRFSRVRAAVGADCLRQAKRAWEQKDPSRAILEARAAVLGAPRNLDARLFLAGCWQKAGHSDEAIQTLRAGMEFNAADPRLQKALVETALATGRFKDVLKALREQFPSRGVRLLEGPAGFFQEAEVRAVLETTGAAEAARIARQRPGLEEVPGAAPLLARIDWETGMREEALGRLLRARDRDPADPDIPDACVETALRLGRAGEARAAADRFLAAFPDLPAAQLRFLEAHGTRQGADRRPWTAECMRILLQHRGRQAVLERLASLAAAQGWTDLAYLLYQDSLSENLTGFPFAIYYAGSLVKAGDFAAADGMWRELMARNAAQIAPASYMSAMIDWGAGRESDALQIAGLLRRGTADDLRRRRSLGDVFRTFGFPKIADELFRPDP